VGKTASVFDCYESTRFAIDENKGQSHHPPAAGNRDRSIVDRSVSLGQPGAFGEPPLWREMQIAYNGQVLWPANAFQDGQPHMAEFRRTYAEVDQAKSCVAVVGTEFGQEPSRVRVQGEQLDNRQRVALLAARGGGAIVQQLDAVIVGDEWFHGRCAQVVTINEALVLRKRADASKLDRAGVLLRQIAKADSTESVGTRIGDCVST